MANAARVPLSAFRSDPFQEIIVFSGIDLTAATMAMAIRRFPDDALGPLITLATTATPGAQGLRFLEVTQDADGIDESWVEVLILKGAVQALPTAVAQSLEVGDSVPLYYDLTVTPAADAGTAWTEQEQTYFYGPFTVIGSAAA